MHEMLCLWKNNFPSPLPEKLDLVGVVLRFCWGFFVGNWIGVLLGLDWGFVVIGLGFCWDVVGKVLPLQNSRKIPAMTANKFPASFRALLGS